MTSKVVEDLYIRRNKINQQINKIQDSCSHPRIKYKYKSNTGNWCPADDSYWVEIQCLDCDKSFTVYSNESEYYIGKGVYGKDYAEAIK